MKRWAIIALLITAPALATDITVLRDRIQEGNTSVLTVIFRDDNGIVVEPDSACVFVDDEKTSLRLFELCPTPLGAQFTEFLLPPQAHQFRNRRGWHN